MNKRGSINGGIIMIVVGVVFLLINMFPGLAERLDIGRQWPIIIVIVGLFFLISAVVSIGDMAIPGSIVLGIGGILYYQNFTGNWASWAFVWTLIPGFVGVGLVLASLLQKGRGEQRRAGVRLVGMSALLFIIFALFFTGLGSLGQFWPVLLILLGLWLMIRNRLPDRS